MSRASIIVDELLEAMDRRHFLRLLGLGGAALAASPALTATSGAAPAAPFVPKGWTLGMQYLFGRTKQRLFHEMTNGYHDPKTHAFIPPMGEEVASARWNKYRDEFAKIINEPEIAAKYTSPEWNQPAPYDPEGSIPQYPRPKPQPQQQPRRERQPDPHEQHRQQRQQRQEQERLRREREAQNPHTGAGNNPAKTRPNTRSRFDYAGGSEDTGYAEYYESRAQAIVNSLLEADEPFDPREYLMGLPTNGKVIRISYSIYTEDSIEAGDAADHGWEDEEGVDMEPDQWDAEDGVTAAKKAIKFLNEKGAIHPSSSHFHPGVWYTDSNTDWENGELTERSYHLANFTPEEEQEIFNEVALKI